MSERTPFWKTKSLDEMSPDEWESLCDGCGRCCMVKLEDEDSGAIHLTRLSCELLDIGSCRCGDYSNRKARMPDCLSVDLEAVKRLSWLPQTCAYRVVGEGRDLAWWHPLVSGSSQTVHEAGVSVRHLALNEAKADPAKLHKYIIDGFPKQRRRKKSERAG